MNKSLKMKGSVSRKKRGGGSECIDDYDDDDDALRQVGSFDV